MDKEVPEIPLAEGTEVNMRDGFPEEFAATLNAEPLQAVLARFQRVGGSPDRLVELLWRLWREGKKRRSTAIFRQTHEYRLRRFEASAKGLLVLGGLSPSLRRAVTRALGEVQSALSSALSSDEPEGPAGEDGNPPLNQGGDLAPPDVVLRLLAEEFCRRFGSPSYPEILTLAQTTRPDRFGPALTPLTIRRRIERTNRRHRQVALGVHLASFGARAPREERLEQLVSS